MQRHDEFDMLIKTEQLRIRKVGRYFIWIDIIVGICILPFIGFSHYYINVDDDQPNSWKYHIAFFSIEVSFSAILAGAAIYLTKKITQLTSKKPNTCLILWHVMNVFLGAFFSVANGIFFSKYQDARG